jgi:unsaturated rhamnogalacturonyl hydrolase
MVSKDELESAIDRLATAMKGLGGASFEEKFQTSLVSMDMWEWPQGIGLYGLWKLYEHKNAPDILEYLESWFSRYLTYNEDSSGPHYRVSPLVERNVNTTAPMLTLAFLYEKTGKSKYSDAIIDWIRWVENGLVRTGDDAFQHMITGNPNSGQILIDTIFMTLLFLAKASSVLDRSDLAREVSYQVMIHAKYLLDIKTGLFFHGWDFDGRHHYGAVLWARGNAWYCAGLMELLGFEVFEPTIHRYLLSLYRNQAEALLYRQDNSGLWHTVLDDPSSYTESSASAGFLYGMAKGVRYGLLNKRDYLPALSLAAEGLLRLVAENGLMSKVSYGTPVGNDAEFYREIPMHPMTYGQALAILAFQELQDPFWSEIIVKP